MNPRVLIPVCCCLLSILGAGRSPGQSSGSASLPVNPDSVLTATVAAFPGEGLRLEDALATAKVQATTARIAQAQLDAAENAVRREKGQFDPELFGSMDFRGSDTPSASLFAGADILKSESSELAAGARMKTRWGTELTASLNSLRSTSNSDFAALSPQYESFGEFSLRQPLLKGFGPSAQSGLKAAQYQRDGAQARYQGALLSVEAEVETVYWQLYAAERNHAVNLMILDRAQAFLKDTQLRAQAGMIGPSQVANAEFFLTEAQQSVLDSEEQLDRFSDRLASFMGRRSRAVRYRPSDDPPRDFPLVQQDDLVAEAMVRNPELQAFAQDTKSLKARESGAIWDARPSLDLVGGIGGNGLSGQPQDVYPFGSSDPVRTDINGTRSDAMSQAYGRDFPTWNVGLVFSLPLGNRQGKGERDRIRAEVTRAEQQLLAVQRSFEEEVRAQHRELERGQKRLEIATRGVSASYKQVEIGMIEYNNGQATAFELVRLAADLATAQQRYSAALVRTARAAASLRQLTGGWYPQTGTQENRS